MRRNGRLPHSKKQLEWIKNVASAFCSPSSISYATRTGCGMFKILCASSKQPFCVTISFVEANAVHVDDRVDIVQEFFEEDSLEGV